MFGNKKEWVARKKQLARKQEEFAERQNNSTVKLKRVRVTARGKIITDYEAWPADRAVLQRIATHMERPTEPWKIIKRLNTGEKVTNKYGDVYSLIPLSHH